MDRHGLRPRDDGSGCDGTTLLPPLKRALDAKFSRSNIRLTQHRRLDLAGMNTLLLKLDFMQRIARGKHALADD